MKKRAYMVSQYGKCYEQYCREYFYHPFFLRGKCTSAGWPCSSGKLPYLCRTDHFLAEVMHARLIRTKAEALGGDCCDYWYVGDQSPALTEYEDLPKI